MATIDQMEKNQKEAEADRVMEHRCLPGVYSEIYSVEDHFTGPSSDGSENWVCN